MTAVRAPGGASRARGDSMRRSPAPVAADGVATTTIIASHSAVTAAARDAVTQRSMRRSVETGIRQLYGRGRSDLAEWRTAQPFSVDSLRAQPSNLARPPDQIVPAQACAEPTLPEESMK